MQKQWQQFVRFGFRLLYQEMAWSYDAVSWLVSLGQWRQWQQQTLHFLPPATTAPLVLEIGHGPGHLLVDLAAREYRPIGLDLSTQMGRMARQRTNGRFPLLQASVMAIPLQDGVVDVVLSTFPTDYIINPSTLCEVKRVLRPNGRLIIVPQAKLTGRTPIHRLIELAFRLTGQRTLATDQQVAVDEATWGPLHQALTAVGFSLTQHIITLPGSIALVIIAEKHTPS